MKEDELRRENIARLVEHSSVSLLWMRVRTVTMVYNFAS